MAVASIGYVFAYRRKGRVSSVAISGRRIELQTPGDPAAVFDAIAAIGAPYDRGIARASSLTSDATRAGASAPGPCAT